MTTTLPLIALRRTLCGALLATALPFALAQGQTQPSAKAPPPTTSSAPSEAERLVFTKEHLANLREPRTLRYVYVEEVAGKPTVTDRAVLTLTAGTGGACCDVHGDFLSGPLAVSLPDIPQARANPVLLYFLENEVRVLQKATGGQAPHFRRRMRLSFADDAQVTDTTIPWHGQAVPARMVRVVPFRTDPYRNRFLAQSATEYAFVLSDAVPGGVYQMSATVPGKAGAAPLARRTLTFDEGN
jgi:hypothetical protein